MRSLSPCLTLLLPLALGAGEKQDANRPNFVIMIADDVGWDDVGCYGNPHVRTPNLDAFANQGIRFDAAFLTCSSCSPSRCSILTGRYPHSTGAAELHMPLPAKQVTIAKLLKEAGYFTASAGKWHLGPAPRKHFDRIEGGSPSGCEKWLDVLKGRPKDQPFFLWLASLDAHRPYQKNTIPRPHSPDEVVVPPFLSDVPGTRRDLALYYDEITRLDGHVGAVLKELNRQGVRENTYVIFLSDNGRPFPRCKTTVYDDGIKTPFLVSGPGLKPGVRKGLVSMVDLSPTVASLAGLKQSPTFQGKSFAPVLTDAKAAHRDHIVGEHNWHDYQAHERAVRTDRHLYIRNAFPQLTGSPPADAVRGETFLAMRKLEAEGKLTPGQRGCFVKPRKAEELYDVRSDPYCLKNLVGDRSHAETLEKLRVTLDEWVKQTDDRVPEKPTPDRFDRATGDSLKKP